VYRKGTNEDTGVTSPQTRAQTTTAEPGRNAGGGFELKRLRDAWMQAPALICITVGPEHRIESVNTRFEESIGGGRTVIGLPMREAFPDAPPEMIEALDAVYSTGQPYESKEVLESVVAGEGDVTDCYFDVVVQPLLDPQGAVYGLVRHAVDVTEQVRTRQELADIAGALERTNHELDSFAYAASHDLRAPLRGIANLAQWIEEDLLSNAQASAETREMLELMRVRMHRMEGLIEGLLEYSRAGRAHKRPERVDVGELVEDVIDLLAPPEGVVIRVEPEMPTFMTERLMLQQVFMNLVSNALKHAVRDDAVIDIGWCRVGPFYEFFVRDNGPGIDPEYHDRIWGIFQTLEARDRVEGAGIGLALVKKIVESQKGRAWVESAPGTGATFRFLWRK
jgi:signal transduction histidine kinase